MINDINKYSNKCGKCGTWSVNYNSNFEMCMDGDERWFKNFWCDNCGGECSILDEESNRNWAGPVKDGETVDFD